MWGVRSPSASMKKNDEREGLLPSVLPTSTSCTSSGTAFHSTGARNHRVDSEDADHSVGGFSALSPGRSLPHPLPNVSHSTALHSIISSWTSRKFMQGCAILFPIAVTFYLSWWFLAFFDQFFSPLYFKLLGFHVFGLGFITSMLFIFLIGVFLSTWLGSILLGLGEWVIVQLPIIKQIYSASKQVSTAVRPDNEQGEAFKECVLIKHPRDGSYAIAFVTGTVTLQMKGEPPTQLFATYVPTNHVYLGDVLLLAAADVIHTDLSVAQGMEIVVSMGMAVPATLLGRYRSNRLPQSLTSAAAGGLLNRH